MEMIFHSYASLLRRGLFVLLGGWGEKKKTARGEQWEGGREKRGLFPPFPSSDRAPRTIYFFYYCYFYRDTQPEPLRRRELKR